MSVCLSGGEEAPALPALCVSWYKQLMCFISSCPPSFKSKSPSLRCGRISRCRCPSCWRLDSHGSNVGAALGTYGIKLLLQLTIGMLQIPSLVRVVRGTREDTSMGKCWCVVTMRGTYVV